MLIPLVDARGVAGAVSECSEGGGILTGRGNNGLSFLVLRIRKRLVRFDLGVFCGFGWFAKLMWSPELASERDDSDNLGWGGAREDALRETFPDEAGGLGLRGEGACSLTDTLDPDFILNKPFFNSSVDFRGRSCSTELGSYETGRFWKGERIIRRFGGRSVVGGCSIVGEVVMIAGAVAQSLISTVHVRSDNHSTLWNGTYEVASPAPAGKSQRRASSPWCSAGCRRHV